MNLFLAVFWFLFGIGVLVWEWTTHDYSLRRLPWQNVSVGWLMLALAVYNVIRWQMTASYREMQRAARIAEMQRELHHRREPHEPPPSGPDPNFDFTRETPPADSRVTDRPPSNN